LALERADAEAPVYLFINCPGGEVYSGFSIFDTARFIRPKVVTVVTGLAASMGSIISLCAQNPKTATRSRTQSFLVHQPLMSGGLAGSATDIAIHARDLIDTKNKIIELYARECGRTIEDIKKALDRDTWLKPPAGERVRPCFKNHFQPLRTKIVKLSKLFVSDNDCLHPARSEGRGR
jgi:ATP-dependent Clp protease protease subunit